MIKLEKSHENPVTYFPKLEVGQKVTIKSLDWYNANKNEDTGAIILDAEVFVEEMAEYCGKTATILDAFKDLDGESDAIMYRIDLDNRGWNWTEEMFEPEMVEDVRIQKNNCSVIFIIFNYSF